MKVSSNSSELSKLFKNDRFFCGHWCVGEEYEKKGNQSVVDPESGGEAPSGGCLSAKGLDAGHLEDVGSGFEGFGRSAVAGEKGNPGLAATEVERLRIWVVEREGVPELAGEAQKVTGRVGRWRKQMERRGGVPVLRLGAAGRTGVGSVGRPPMPRVINVVRPNRVRPGGPGTGVR